MNAMDAIRERRSIRKYTDKPVEKEKLEALVEFGFLAPSGSNAQNWFFTVITDEALLGRLEQEGKEAVIAGAGEFYQNLAAQPGYKLLHGAPCFIIASYDPAMNVGAVDCALAIENICLAATEMGLGTCINGLINYMLNKKDKEDLRAEFGIPAGFLCASGISIGYPAETPAPRPRDRSKVGYLLKSKD